MAPASDLLRMLEPAVRPTVAGSISGTDRSRHQPIEQRSFESILAEARQMAAGDEGFPTASRDKPPGPLDQLASVDRIENADIRKIVQGAQVSAEHEAQVNNKPTN